MIAPSKNLLRHCLLLGCLLTGYNAHAEDVVSFDRPPSLEELKQAIGVNTPKKRSIVMDNAAAEETNHAAPAASPAKAIAIQLKFQSGSARIATESIGYLETVAALLKQAPTMSLVVEGHTDASGRADKNQKLSAERAESVKNYLVDKLGVEAQRIQAVGKGSSEPLAGKDPRFPGNRRVQLRFAS